jgi:hypothetical protein
MLSRLRAVDESVADLAALRARAMRCCASPMWKVRVLAARVVASLTEPERVSDVLHSTLAESLHGNAGHGAALTIRYIVESHGRGRVGVGMPDAVSLLGRALLAAVQPGPLRCCPICIELAVALESALTAEINSGVNDDVDYTKLAAEVEAAALEVGATAEPHRERLVAQLVSLSTTIRCRLAAALPLVSDADRVGDSVCDADFRGDALAPTATVLRWCHLNDAYDGFARAIVAERPTWSPAAARQLVTALASPRELSPDAVESALVALETFVGGTDGTELLLAPTRRGGGGSGGGSGGEEAEGGRLVGPRAPTTFELNSEWFPKDFSAHEVPSGAVVSDGKTPSSSSSSSPLPPSSSSSSSSLSLTLGAVLALVERLLSLLGGSPQSLSTAAYQLVGTTLAVTTAPSPLDTARLAAFFGERVLGEPSLGVRRVLMRGLGIAAVTLGHGFPLELWHTVLEHAQDDSGEIRWLARVTIDNARGVGGAVGPRGNNTSNDVVDFVEQVSPTSTVVAAFALLDELTVPLEEKVCFVLERLLLYDNVDHGNDGNDDTNGAHAADNVVGGVGAASAGDNDDGDDDGGDGGDGDIAGSEEPPSPNLATEPATVLLHAHGFLAAASAQPSTALSERTALLVDSHLAKCLARLSAAVASVSGVDVFDARRQCDGALALLLLRLAPAAAVLCQWGLATGRLSSSLKDALVAPDLGFVEGAVTAPWPQAVSDHLSTVLGCLVDDGNMGRSAEASCVL